MRRTDQRRAAIVALYQQDVTGRPLDELLEKSASLFTRELTEGVEVEREELDALIERHAEGWTLDRIAPLERNILRVALHELLHRSDIPDEVAGQLGNRVQHALRAFTPRDQKAIEAAAETFRINPGLDVATAITELRTGEALVSVLDESGAPTPVERTAIRPPFSRAGPLTDKERAILRSISPIGDKYDEMVDRESAHELLTQRAEAAATAAAQAKAQKEALKAEADAAKAQRAQDREQARVERDRQRNAPIHEQMAKQLGRSVQRQLTNRVAGQIIRGIFGSLFRGR